MNRGQVNGGQAGVTCPRCGWKLAWWEPLHDTSGLITACSVFTCQSCDTTWMEEDLTETEEKK